MPPIFNEPLRCEVRGSDVVLFKSKLPLQKLEYRLGEVGPLHRPKPDGLPTPPVSIDPPVMSGLALGR